MSESSEYVIEPVQTHWSPHPLFKGCLYSSFRSAPEAQLIGMHQNHLLIERPFQETKSGYKFQLLAFPIGAPFPSLPSGYVRSHQLLGVLVLGAELRQYAVFRIFESEEVNVEPESP